MTTITLEVPDEVAAQLQADPARLPALIREAVAEKLALSANSATTLSPVYQEFIDFLASSPTLEQMVDFKISDAAQQRVEDLLDKDRENELTPEEKAELNRYFQYRHIMILLKAGARRAIDSRPGAISA
ncbi:MAG: hypothetical protein ACREAB_01545 [Blastocatellia bacterium]